MISTERMDSAKEREPKDRETFSLLSSTLAALVEAEVVEVCFFSLSLELSLSLLNSLSLSLLNSLSLSLELSLSLSLS